MVTIIPGDETVYAADEVPRPTIKICRDFITSDPKHAGVIKRGTKIIAHIPQGFLTESIVNKIMIAYNREGRTLTLEEVQPFYKEG
jgi:hypothetical protein